MKHIFTVNDAIIQVEEPNNHFNESLPLVLCHIEENDVDFYTTLLQQNCPSMILVTISNLEWQTDLCPWDIPPVNKYIQCHGGANNYISQLQNQILPMIKEKVMHPIKRYIIAGYSLSGLFALYAPFHLDIFEGIVCASGSLWYPKFDNYLKKNQWISPISTVYLSLGDKEHHTKNKIMASVKDRILIVYDYLRQHGINVIFEQNPGNHFQNTDLRLAKGIIWVISNLDSKSI